MWKTIGVVGATVAIIGGAGTVAVAASGTTPTPSTSASSVASGSPAKESAAKPGRHRGQARFRGQARLRGAVHVTWVSRDRKTKAFTTHEAIRGRVSAVSPTSITVKAADGVTEKYVVNPGTRVRLRGNKAAASISDVKIGDPVRVAGTGTTTLTAKRVMDAKK